ncbi:MAG: TetR/AcrR family transcriptional regulator [Gaiella sp.]
MGKTRTYELKRRAERQDETRRRIVEAAVELHTTVGPARTTVAAVAERAGVTRPTVYAHFPDADALFRACSGHVRATVPPPELEPWSAIEDPAERLRDALAALYAYYERLEPLLDNILRDAPVLPVVREVGAYRARYLEQLSEVLLPGWPVTARTRARLRHAIGHALDFRTWQSLVRGQGCARDEAVELMVLLVRSTAAESPRPTR